MRMIVILTLPLLSPLQTIENNHNRQDFPAKRFSSLDLQVKTSFQRTYTISAFRRINNLQILVKIVRAHVGVGNVDRVGCVGLAHGRNPLHTHRDHSLLVLQFALQQ
jgi:hypothetical protein